MEKEAIVFDAPEGRPVVARTRTETPVEAAATSGSDDLERAPAFAVPDLLRTVYAEKQGRGWSGFDEDEIRSLQAVAELAAEFSRQDPELLSRCPALRDVVWRLARWTEDWEDMQ